MKKIFIGTLSMLIGSITLGTSLMYLLYYMVNHSTYNMIYFIFNIVITIILGVISFKCLRSKEINKIKSDEFTIILGGMLEIIKTSIAICFILPPENGIIYNRTGAMVIYLFMLSFQIVIVWKRKALINIFKEMKS